MRRPLVIAVLAGALATALTTPALAAKGHGGGGTTTPTAAWVSASPNPAAPGTTVMVSGCGFQFAPAAIHVTHSGSTDIYWATVWASGGNCFSTSFKTAEAGTYSITVTQSVGKRGATAQLASTTLRVG